jgi:hypothetical protein
MRTSITELSFRGMATAVVQGPRNDARNIGKAVAKPAAPLRTKQLS